MLQTRLTLLLLIGITLAQAATLNKPAPGFVLPDSHHHKKTLTGYKGQILFINFWASWCGPCREELPELNRLATEYKNKNVQILVINVDENRESGTELLATLGLQRSDFKVLWDSRSKVVTAYDIEAMPSSYIIDKNGIIRFSHVGYRRGDNLSWRKEIDRLISS